MVYLLEYLKNISTQSKNDLIDCNVEIFGSV